MADRTEAAVRENVAAERRYLESCSELSSAISTLESAVTAFVGKDRGDIKVSTRRWTANPDRPWSTHLTDCRCRWLLWLAGVRSNPRAARVGARGRWVQKCVTIRKLNFVCGHRHGVVRVSCLRCVWTVVIRCSLVMCCYA